MYTDGTLSAFVASLAPGDTGCAYATFREGVKITNGGFKLRGPHVYGYVWITSSANSITLEDVYFDNRDVSTAYALLVQGDNVTLRRAEVTNGNKPAAGTTLRGSFTVTGTTARWYEVDLTAYLNSLIAAGRRFVTLVLRAPTNSLSTVLFNSDEAEYNAPELVIT